MGDDLKNYLDYIKDVQVSVLYVEDDSSVRHSMMQFLKRRFKIVYEAEDGAIGLKEYIDKKPDIVITDIRMPNMDGLEMISEIRKVTDEIPQFIVTSAFSDEDYLLSSIDLGVIKYVVKPLRISEFKTIIREASEVVKLKKYDKIYNTMINHLLDNQDAIVLLSNGDELLKINKQGLKVAGYSSAEELQKEHKCFCEIFKKERGFLTQELFQEFLNSDKIREKVKIFDKSIGEDRIYTIKSNRYNRLFIITLLDITDIDNINRNLEEKNHKLQNYYNIINEYIIASETDIAGNITSISDAFAHVTGYDREELLGKNHKMLRYPEQDYEKFRDLWVRLSRGETWVGEFHNLTKDKKELWFKTIIKPKRDRDGNIIGYSALSEDITLKKRLEELSVTDQLTKIYNRRKLDEIIHDRFAEFNRYETPTSFIFGDIDKFKSINDTYGHNIGDEVLVKFASILKESIRKTDYIGRWGGEEFLLVLSNTDSKSTLEVAEKLRERVELSNFSSKNLTVTASFGVTSFKKDDERIEDTFIRLDNSLYDAKDGGRNMVVLR
jgi:diguanylate cyclase (GGDEF)-like protein/PAS domain S-box-containing protein